MNCQLVPVTIRRCWLADLHPDTLFNSHFLIDEHSDEIEVGVASRRVGDLDLLESTFDELKAEWGRIVIERQGQGWVASHAG